MNFKKYNNLIDLFFEQCEKQPKDKIFLSSLNNSENYFTWNDVRLKVLHLANEFAKIIKKGDSITVKNMMNVRFVPLLEGKVEY